MSPHDPIFESLSHALHVAFLMETVPASQVIPTALVLQTLRKRSGVWQHEASNSRIHAGDLNPLEFRAQCAMIRGAVVDQLMPAEAAAIHAAYGHQRTQAAGVRGVVDYVLPLVSTRREVLHALMWSMCHKAARDDKAFTVRALADSLGVPKSTLFDARKTLREHYTALTRRAYDRLGDALQGHGVCPDYDEAY